jgi:hypothetical protein
MQVGPSNAEQAVEDIELACLQLLAAFELSQVARLECVGIDLPFNEMGEQRFQGVCITHTADPSWFG